VADALKVAWERVPRWVLPYFLTMTLEPAKNVHGGLPRAWSAWSRRSTRAAKGRPRNL
jgi:hypothetical protein